MVGMKQQHFVLSLMVAKELEIPLIAAGGIGTGRTMLAAMNLGADAVQIGSRFVASARIQCSRKFQEDSCRSKRRRYPTHPKRINPCSID